MSIVYVGLAVLASYVLCLVFACHAAFRESRGAGRPPATARQIRRAQQRQLADLRKVLPADRTVRR